MYILNLYNIYIYNWHWGWNIAMQRNPRFCTKCDVYYQESCWLFRISGVWVLFSTNQSTTLCIWSNVSCCSIVILHSKRLEKMQHWWFHLLFMISLCYIYMFHAVHPLPRNGIQDSQVSWEASTPPQCPRRKSWWQTCNKKPSQKDFRIV